MKEFKIFTFEKFSFDQEKLEARFFYNFDNWTESFEEIIDFKTAHPLTPSLWRRGEVLNNFLFNLHIALWISYYKLFPTKTLEIKSGFLNDEQILFWKKFYRNGLWEFFIKNDIDFSELINFKNMLQQGGVSPLYENKIDKNLLLWWWGKDSITSYSLLKKQNQDFDLFVFWKIDAIKKNTAKIAEKEILLVKRQLSTNLFKLNKQWYYNWHVPITGIIAFTTFVFSYLYWYSKIILSNEKSASENNTVWKWLNINHQYSKSLEFEEDLQEYLNNYISKDIKYFSLLRWMYEYKIAEIFSWEKKFFSSFSSCNKNFKIKAPYPPTGTFPQEEKEKKKIWCCECEKCCFVFLILSPFLEEKELISIFWENLFNKTSLEKTFRELIWLENYKPFECVWTYEESLLSAKKCISKNMNWIILKKIKQEILNKCNTNTEHKLDNKLLKIN
jgi:hypothetical protein